MSIKIYWDDQSAKGLSAIEIYRKAGAPVDDSAPGSPLATLDPSAITYNDATALQGVLYYYRIAVVKDGQRAWSANNPEVIYSDYGPGKSSLWRGSPVYGWMDVIPSAELLDRNSLQAMIPELAANAVNVPWTQWYKFIVDGKILYSPVAVNPLSMSYTALNNAGLVFGTDVTADLPSWAAVGVNHKRIVTINERDYIFRLLKGSPLSLATFITTYAQSAKSEARKLWTPFMKSSSLDAASAPTAVPRLGEATVAYSNAMTQHLSSAGNVMVVNGGTEVMSTAAIGTNTPTTFVLELMP